MNTEQWEQLVERLQSNFPGAKVFTEDLEGVENGKAEIVEFNAPHGRFRIVRENRPLVLEKKLHYSHRPGDTARAEYKFSDTEFTHKLRVYKESNDYEWEEVTLDQLGL